MIDVRDRVPATGKANRKKLTFEDDSTVRYARVEPADEAAVEGTPVNRALFNDLQGFANITTAFGSDGTITETDRQSGAVKTTVFNADGSITETRTGNGAALVKTTTFAADGTITETIA